MQLLRWQAGNSLANYQYIVVDSERRAVLIDPLDVAEIRQLVSAENLTIAAVLVTHEHQDHAGEAGHLQKLYGVPVYAHERAVAAIAADAIPLQDGAELRISSELVFRCHHTPGHTPGHVVFSAGGMLFSGDCLFHAGCGHCRSTGADLQEHYRSLTERLAALNLDLLLFPGHYYARRNLDFALHVE
ncbi:MAG: MBL fold metallo-hydrolase, partial [Turneriella sp.]|nr:MBL fold metallo-hydrolase [Turneriella sp.]